MMHAPVYVEAHDANTLYKRALGHVLAYQPDVAPRGMATTEVLGASVRLNDASRCVVTWPERKLNYHFMVAEWWWIATGRSNVASIKPYCNEIAKYSDDGETFFGAYGPPWTEQLPYVVRKLRQDPDSRQAVATIWRPSPPDTKDVPCTIAMQYLWRAGALHAVVTMRSWDAYLGFCYDVFNFSRLLAIVAGELGNVPIGSLQVNAGSFHVYERDREKAATLLATWVPEIQQVGQAPHPGVSPQLGPLPGAIPENLSGQIMGSKMFCTRSGQEAWKQYIDVMNHRRDPEDTTLRDPWDRLLA